MAEASEPAGPRISVVLVTRDDWRTLRPALRSFGALSGAGDLEVVVVAPTARVGTPPARYAAPFHSVVTVGAGPIVSRGRAAGGGVRAAGAPIVALSENHCFPEDGWVERVIEAHAEESRAGVGPGVLNANPGRARSRVAHVAGYGMYDPAEPAGERDQLPLHNSSFRRAAAMAQDASLDELLADERRFWDVLRAAGGTLWFDPSIRKRHINESTWRLVVGIAWYGGRRYAGDRARDWPVARRWAYAAAGPLITVPVFRNLWRVRGRVVPPAERSTLRDLIATGIFAMAHAAGEAASYLVGPIDRYPFIEEDEFMITERLPRGDPAPVEVAGVPEAPDEGSDQPSEVYASSQG